MDDSMMRRLVWIFGRMCKTRRLGERGESIRKSRSGLFGMDGASGD